MLIENQRRSFLFLFTEYLITKAKDAIHTKKITVNNRLQDEGNSLFCWG